MGGSMYQRLGDLAVGEVVTVTGGDPAETILDRLSSSAASFAVVVENERRIAAADEHGRHPLVEVSSDIPVRAILGDSDALRALEEGSPGILLLDGRGEPTASVDRFVVLQALTATGSQAGTLGDVMLPGLPPSSLRAFVCGRCGFTNHLGVVVRGRTQCQNPATPRHAIP